jgi:conjugal transfer mating pair stabilization protein TraG
MCKECLETMETLQKKIQALNRGFANSCQLANDHGARAIPKNVSHVHHDRFPHPNPLPKGKGDVERATRDFHRKGLVNDVADAFDRKHKDNTSLLGMVKGLGDTLYDVDIGNRSILSLYKLDFLLQDYLATGGMLAASTPAISLMLIYGSAITATHLASRFQGGDFVDEKITSPDVVRPAPALAMSPIMEHASLRGTITTGADNVFWRADVGQSVQRDLSSSQRVAEETSQQFTSGLASAAAAASASRAGETFEGRAMGWSYESSGSQMDRALLQEAESLTHRYAESGLSSQQFATALSAGIGASNKSDRGA